MRNDAATRRFIQYLSMQSSSVVCLVRDAKTGRTFVSPPEDQLRLTREKSRLGRASKHEYRIISEVGPKHFEQMEHYRQRRFSFMGYYDIYIWDLQPGRPGPALYNEVQDVSDNQ